MGPSHLLLASELETSQQRGYYSLAAVRAASVAAAASVVTAAGYQALQDLSGSGIY